MTFYESTYYELLRFLRGETSPSRIELKNCLKELLGHELSKLLQNSQDVSISDVKTDLIYLINFIKTEKTALEKKESK